MHDVIVVGARCAGASTALLLARRGCKVLLIDRAAFPSDIPRGHFIHRHGPRRLRDWGLLDRITEAGCPPVRSITSAFDDDVLSADGLEADGVAVGYGPRRQVLDKVLVDAAVEAGAELWENVTVDQPLLEGDRVAGVRAHARDGGAAMQRAIVTVGADGRNSTLARILDPPVEHATASLTVWFFAYWSGVAGDGLEVLTRGRTVVFAFPTTGSLYAVFVAWPASELPLVRRDVERAFMTVVRQHPTLADRLAAGRREERFQAAADVPNFIRRAHGPGWALVGDAACHKDPFLALGVCDALRDAEMLAEAIYGGLSSPQGWDVALAGYDDRRRQATLADYHQNIERARFAPLPDELVRLRQAVRGDAEATRRFFLAGEGLIPRDAVLGAAAAEAGPA
jgi:flavin-dependent dehydrogenase